jgi:hypothetical protein
MTDMDTKHRSPLFLFAVLLSAAVVASGCKSDTNAPENTKTYPGVGSTFQFKKTPLDNNGYAYTSYPDSTRNLMVIEGPHSFAGKDSVITFVENSTDTIRICSEKDGDISLYMPYGLPWQTTNKPAVPKLPHWWPLPVKSGKKVVFASIDTSVTVYQGSTAYKFKHITATSAFISQAGPYTIVGKDAITRTVDITFDYDYDYLGSSGTLTFTYHFVYAEEIGYFTSYSIVNAVFDPGVYLGNYAMTIEKCEWK